MSHRILLVDDDAAVLAMLGESLRLRGLEVTACADGACAVSRIQNRRFDAALFDLRLPGPSGIELLSRFRKRQPKAPAFVMSGNLTAATLETADALGARSIEKPFDVAKVCDAVAEAAGASSDARPWSILVVDDEPALANLLRAHLSEVGFQVAMAGDGAEALRLLAASPRPFDIAFIDINMPHLNGISLIRELTRLSPDTLPIIMTGEGTSEQVREAYRAGVETMIRKPFAIGGLPRVIESLEVTLQERRKRVAERRALENRTILRRCVDAVLRVPTAPPSTLPGKVRFALVAAVAALALVGLARVTGEAVEEAARREARERQQWIELLREGRDRAGASAAVLPGGGGDAFRQAVIDPAQLRGIQGFCQRVEDYLRRDEERELQGADAPVRLFQDRMSANER